MRNVPKGGCLFKVYSVPLNIGVLHHPLAAKSSTGCMEFQWNGSKIVFTLKIFVILCSVGAKAESMSAEICANF